VFVKLGLTEDEREAKAREEGYGTRYPKCPMNEFGDELLCVDHLPDDRISICDRKNPDMSLGSRYKNMVTFRLAMHYIIKREFELVIEATCSTEVTVKDENIPRKFMQG
jgi:hypothetical protein